MAGYKQWGRFILVLVLMIALPAWADEGKELFEKQCASCHTIGGGDSGGPDLKGIAAKRPAAWLERVIVEPDRLTADKDPLQAELVKQYGYEMPNLGISHDDARKIIAYLRGGTPPTAAKTPKAAPASSPAAQQNTAIKNQEVSPPLPVQQPAKSKEPLVTPELVATGKALFTGGKKFMNGGAPCAACHGFSYPGMQGGNLAADLTGLYTRMGEQGVRGALKSLKFPVMKKIYADRGLTDEEIDALIAFTKDATLQKSGGGGLDPYPLAGVGLFVLFMLGMTLYKRRIR
jgi:mono/diheme cytochrome c family protein